MKNTIKAIAKKLLQRVNNRGFNHARALEDIAHHANEAKNGRYYELGNGTILTMIYTGQIIAVDQNDLSLAPHLILKGEWEKELTDRCEMLVRSLESPVIFDVGANFGWYGLTLSRFSSTSTVHYFEANPDITNLLSKTVLVNGLPLRAKINNLAVSDKSGEQLSLKVLRMHKGSSSIFGFNLNLEKYYESEDAITTFKVESTSIDDYCKINAIGSIDFMKVDVEGAEEKVIVGAKETIAKSNRLSMMLEWNAGMYTEEMLRVLKAFKSCGGLDHEGNWQDLSAELKGAKDINNYERLVSSRLNSQENRHDLFFYQSDWDENW